MAITSNVPEPPGSNLRAVALRLKWWLRGIFLVFIPIVLVLPGSWTIFSDNSAAIGISLGEAGSGQSEVPLSLAWPTAVGTAALVVLMLAVFWLIDRLFTAFQRNEMLSAANARRIRWIGWLTLLLAVIECGASAVQNLVLMPTLLGQDGGEPVVTIQFNAMIFMAGVVTISFAHVLERAALLEEDAKLTI